LDTDGDGKVNSADVADSTKTYKGNDIDSNGDGVVDQADNADKLDGNDATAFNTDNQTGTNTNNVNTGQWEVGPNNRGAQVRDNTLFIGAIVNSFQITNIDSNNSGHARVYYDDGTTDLFDLNGSETKTVNPDSSQRTTAIYFYNDLRMDTIEYEYVSRHQHTTS